MPSYGGINLFGLGVRMQSTQRPREAQINTQFGESWMGRQDGGGRGGLTYCRGTLAGQGSLFLAAAEAFFRDHQDGQARTLIDTMGVPWRSVVLQSFTPKGRVRQSPYGFYLRDYEAVFLHLE